MRFLIVMALAVLCGCTQYQPTAIGPIIIPAVEDSVRYNDAYNNNVYAYIWPSGKINLFCRQLTTYQCTANNVTINGGVQASCVYLGIIDPDGAVTGSLTTYAFNDTVTTVVSSTLTGFVLADTVAGEATTIVNTPCGPRPLSTPYLLYKAP